MTDENIEQEGALASELLPEPISGRAKGGHARANSLTIEQRKSIARKAASARWGSHLPVATHEGEFPIGRTLISCAVLEDGTRIITQAAFLRAMGRARSPKAGTGVLSTVDELPFFLQAEVLKPFITEELRQSTKPIFYMRMEGGKGVGYDARLITKTCEAYLQYRDACIDGTGEIPKRYAHIIKACDMVIRGHAGVAIIALVDEATGYQYDRAKDELSKILSAYISPKLLPWTQRFPHEFFRLVYRLYGWDYKVGTVRHPQYLGKFINKYVYGQMPPGVLHTLQEKNPVAQSGYRRHKNHQFLTVDTGSLHLDKAIVADMTLLQIADNPKEFERLFDRALGKPYQQSLLPSPSSD